MRHIRSAKSEQSLYAMKTWRFKPYIYRGKTSIADEEESQDGERPKILRRRKGGLPKQAESEENSTPDTEGDPDA